MLSLILLALLWHSKQKKVLLVKRFIVACTLARIYMTEYLTFVRKHCRFLEIYEHHENSV